MDLFTRGLAGVNMTEIDLGELERDIWRDYLQDGLMELVMGAYLLLLGLGLAGGHVAIFVVLGVVFGPLAFRALKRRFAYPRTGYVELREGDPGPAPRIILGALLLGLITLVLVLIAVGVIGQPDKWYRWMPISFGIWLAGVYSGLGVAVGLIRYYVLAVLALIAGPLFALLPLTGKLENLGLYLAAVGVVALSWGLVVFVRFLRNHPLPIEEVDDVGG
jgi:hypothetical protein